LKRIAEGTFNREIQAMSIRDFYSKFVSGGERNLLFVALRKLTLLENPLLFFAADDNGWPIWDGSPEPAASAG
jgi:hypothetical protein